MLRRQSSPTGDMWETKQPERSSMGQRLGAPGPDTRGEEKELGVRVDLSRKARISHYTADRE